MARCRLVAECASDNAAIRGLQVKRREVVKLGGYPNQLLHNEPPYPPFGGFFNRQRLRLQSDAGKLCLVPAMLPMTSFYSGP